VPLPSPPDNRAASEASPNYRAATQASPDNRAASEASPNHRAATQASPDTCAPAEALPDHRAATDASPDSCAATETLPGRGAVTEAHPDHSAVTEALPDHSAVIDALPDGCVVTEVVARTGGSLHTVFEVRLAGAEPLIVKRYSGDQRGKQAKEVHVYGLMAGITGVPRIVRADYERAITVFTLLPGKPMWEREPQPAAVRAAYRRIGEFQAALHRIHLPAFGHLTTGIVDPVADNTTYMRQKFARQLAEFRSAGGPADIHDSVARRVAEDDHHFAECSGAVLCHNDLHEGNVLVDDTGTVTGFVDVENAEAADPMTDLAKTIQFSDVPEKRAALLDGYGPLPPHGTERIDLYRMFHALELWTWFTSIGHTEPLPALLDDLRSLSAG
jgi:hygromycin-B 7''-O-kinase